MQDTYSRSTDLNKKTCPTVGDADYMPPTRQREVDHIIPGLVQMRDLSALKYVLVDYKVRIDYLDDVDGVLIEHGLAEM